MSTSELASQVGVGSVFALWFALACRARPALRQPHQRGLWLTVLAATIAITLFQPRVVTGLMNVGVDLHTVTLTRNLIGVLSAGLVLVSMVDIRRARHFRRCVPLTLAVAIGTLLILDLLQLSRPGDGIMSVQGPADPAAAYWLTLIGAHLIGDAVALVVCWAFSLRSSDRDLVWSLRLFAVGSVFAIAFWSGYLWLLYDGTAAILPYLSLVIGVHGFIRAASLLVPMVTAAVRSWTALRVTWRLWPLWRDLVGAVPHVALASPQRTRFREVLLPRSPLALQAHRQTIETYDALLDLHQYVQPGAYEEARRQARRTGLRDNRLAAAALADVLDQARRAKLAGAPPSGSGSLPGVVHGSQETLLGIARMWPSKANTPPVPDRLAPARRP
ncbi:MAB_1171c family putative transporter [Streptomyces sp. NPDC091281]|uniref:MAB_1171c family putative transporter n=1 Tax=Streptomyces sp. NPDC091281 TaxID=3365985 RepID=UPI00380751B2